MEKTSIIKRYSALDRPEKDLALKGFCFIALFIGFFLWWIWPAGINTASTPPTAAQVTTQPAAVTPAPQTPTLSQSDLFLVCTSAIATLFGHPENIMNVDKFADNVVYISYVRPADKTIWKNRCTVEGNKILWASETGRWRTHPADSKLTYQIQGNSITINEIHPDKTKTTASFARR